MIKKQLTITSIAILIAAISVATTMTMVQADPTGDVVVITVPQAIPFSDEFVVGAGAEYAGLINNDAGFPISVNIDDGMVWVFVSSGDPDNGMIQVHIEDINWTGLGPNEDGAIIGLSCEINVDESGLVPLTTAVFTRDSIWIAVNTSGFLNTEFDVHCTFDAVHGEIEKSLGECAPIEIKKEETTPCTFNITYEGASANVIDTIPAAWEEEPIVFDPDECIVDVDTNTNEKGKNKKGNDKSATGITCPDLTSLDVDITITTRESPATVKHDNKDDKFKPTECGDFEVNSSAKAIAVDQNGDPIIGTMDGLPIVIVQTDPENPLTVDAIAGAFACDD